LGRGLRLAITIAWMGSAILLLSSTFLYRVLKERGLIAVERLMGDAARHGRRADVTQRSGVFLGR
jgi:hypothetical protein